MPAKGFADLGLARACAARFARGYHHEHSHSGIRCMRPARRHAGDATAVLAARHELYRQARQRNPQRCSGDTRDWTPVGAVTLDPARDAIVAPRRAAGEVPLAA